DPLRRLAPRPPPGPPARPPALAGRPPPPGGGGGSAGRAPGARRGGGGAARPRRGRAPGGGGPGPGAGAASCARRRLGRAGGAAWRVRPRPVVSSRGLTCVGADRVSAAPSRTLLRVWLPEVKVEANSEAFSRRTPTVASYVTKPLPKPAAEVSPRAAGMTLM